MEEFLRQWVSPIRLTGAILGGLAMLVLGLVATGTLGQETSPIAVEPLRGLRAEVAAQLLREGEGGDQALRCSTAVVAVYGRPNALHRVLGAVCAGRDEVVRVGHARPAPVDPVPTSPPIEEVSAVANCRSRHSSQPVRPRFR